MEQIKPKNFFKWLSFKLSVSPEQIKIIIHFELLLPLPSQTTGDVQKVHRKLHLKISYTTVFKKPPAFTVNAWKLCFIKYKSKNIYIGTNFVLIALHCFSSWLLCWAINVTLIRRECVVTNISACLLTPDPCSYKQNFFLVLHFHIKLCKVHLLRYYYDGV